MYIRDLASRYADQTELLAQREQRQTDTEETAAQKERDRMTGVKHRYIAGPIKGFCKTCDVNRNRHA